MAKGTKATALPRSATPAERDAHWLELFQSIESEGIGIRAYAQREGLSAVTLYSARKRLVKRGALPRTRGARKFTRVRVVDTPPRMRGGRLRLGADTVVEWDETPPAEWLATLLREVTAPR
jgi:hypothetical protein